jgi:large repetitive protein
MKKLFSVLLLASLLAFASPAITKGSTATTTFTLTINAPLVITTPAALPAGVAGASYTTTLQATGGVPPYTWTVNSGSTLPAGLTLTSAGVLSGTPTSGGSYSFGITVTDSKLSVVKANMKVTPAASKKLKK